MNPIKIEEFRSYLKINKEALDDAVIEQPSLFFRVSEAFMLAAAERDTLKERLATADANLDAKIGLDADRADEKVTDNAVKARVASSKTHEQAFTAFMNAKKQADVLLALKDAFQQRSYMLRDMCSLFVANYFEGTSLRGTDRSDKVAYETRRRRLNDMRTGGTKGEE